MKKTWQAPVVVQYDTVVALTAGDDKCGTAMDAFTDLTSLDGDILPEKDCLEVTGQ